MPLQILLRTASLLLATDVDVRRDALREVKIPCFARCFLFGLLRGLLFVFLFFPFSYRVGVKLAFYFFFFFFFFFFFSS